MSDPLTDLISDIQHNGLRWLSIVTLYAIYRKERRNYYLDRRDDAIFKNLKVIMQERGLGECFVENPNLNKNMEEALLKRGWEVISPARFVRLFTRRKVIEKSISRRKNMLTNILKANLSKKLISALVAIGVTALNQKFGLHLTENDITLILGLSLAHISLQTIIDSVKAWALSKAPIIVHEVVPAIQNLVERAIVDPNTTFQDLFPKVKVVHEGLQKIYADIQLNDGSQAFKDASQAYLALHDIFESIKPPVTIPEVVEQVPA